MPENTRAMRFGTIPPTPASFRASADDVVVTNGAQQALDLLGKIFLDPGDEVVVEAPAYVGALSAFSAYEPRVVHVPVDDDGLVVEDLEALLDDGVRPKFLY